MSAFVEANQCSVCYLFYSTNIVNIPCCHLHVGVCPSCSTYNHGQQLQQQQQQQPQLHDPWLLSQDQMLQKLLDNPPIISNQDRLLAQQFDSASVTLSDFAPRRLRRQVEESLSVVVPSVLEDYAPRQLPVQKRQIRPKQHLSQRNIGGRERRPANPAHPAGAGDDIDYGEVHNGGPNHLDGLTDWGIRMERLEGAWTVKRLAMKQQFLQYAPLLDQFKREDSTAHVSRVQQRVDSAWQFHECGGPAPPQQGAFVEQCRKTVRYVQMTCCGNLSIPTWRCSCCQEFSTPDAISAGCFVSTPSAADTWFDLNLMEAYRFLGLEDGLSGTGEYLNHV